jgi:predicted amidophosphoribosyltransferase
VMFGLNPVERTENLKDAFQVGKKISRSPVLLLDDIYTAGTTVKEAAKVLRQQGIKVAGVVVAAKTSRGKLK